MIWTILQISLRRLIHSRSEMLLTFAVPIVFFSIFALIFGRGVGGASTPKINVVAVDEVGDAASRAMMDSLGRQAGLRFVQDEEMRLDREQAEGMVRRGTSTMAIVLRRGKDQQLAVDLLADSSDQVATQVVSSLVQRSLLLVEAHRQIAGFEEQDTAGPASIAQPIAQPIAQRSASAIAAPPRQDQGHPSAPRLATTIQQYVAKPSATEVVNQPVAAIQIDPAVSDVANSVGDSMRVMDVMGEGKTNPIISMYAAGIAVMFLLFGATGGGGALLEERESQTLERLLSTRLTMDQLLLGKWFYMTALGVLQVTVMFLWAHFVFGVDLFGHLDGFLMMTLVTALAASGFGLFLATLCKTRGQLNGLSVILVLSMSALGGSMVPRYIMSERLQQYGLCTFNAWALDGYTKVFWRELPVSALAPQLAVLLFSGMAFLIIARMLAVRWETD